MPPSSTVLPQCPSFSSFFTRCCLREKGQVCVQEAPVTADSLYVSLCILLVADWGANILVCVKADSEDLIMPRMM